MKKPSKSRFFTNKQLKQPKLKNFDCKQKIVDNAIKDIDAEEEMMKSLNSTAEDFKKQEWCLKYNYPPPYPGAPLTENGQKEFEARKQAAKDKDTNADYNAATSTIAETKTTNGLVQEYAQACGYVNNEFEFILKTLIEEVKYAPSLEIMFKLALAIDNVRRTYNRYQPVQPPVTIYKPISHTITTT